MKKILSLLFASALVGNPGISLAKKISPQQGKTIAEIIVSNPSSFEREQQPLIFSLNELGLSKITNLAAYADGQQLVSQLIDRNGDGTNDSLLIMSDFTAEQSLSITVKASERMTQPAFMKLTQAEISHKTEGNWIKHPKKTGFKAYEGGQFKNVSKLTPPAHYTDHSNWIRYEGPGIESDKVAYRFYLDTRNGFDIFGKTTPRNVLQDIGQDGYDSYHKMQPWGMDILKVGQSLGAGGFGYWDGKQIQSQLPATKRTARILNNGVAYSSLAIDYERALFSETEMDIRAQLSMHAGSRLVHNRLTFSKPTNALAIGVVKHPDTQPIKGNLNTTGDAYTYLASWGKQALDDGYLGMAVIFRKRDFTEFVEDAHSYAAIMKARGEKLDYYLLAAWEGEQGTTIKTRQAFIDSLEQEIEKLTLTPRIQLSTAHSQAAKTRWSPSSSANALRWSQWLADSELQRKTLKYHAGGWDTNRRRVPKFEYDIVGLLPYSYAQLGDALGNSKYTDVLHKVTGSFIEDDGSILAYKASNYNIDSIAPGRAVLELYKRTKTDKYRKAAQQLREQLKTHPKTKEGAFWHKKKYPGQLWLDGVYMGMPFLAEYSVLFEDGASLDEVTKEFTLTRKYLREPQTGLYYHAWDETKKQDWADPSSGLSPHFWGRGIGWLAMALVDTLDFIPENKPELRQPLLDMVTELAQSLEAFRDLNTHTWWQIINMPTIPGNYRESSATAMFVYFLAKALNQGYLDSSYKSTALQGYQGMIDQFVTVNADDTISMTNQCLVAGLGFGRDGSFRYYMSEQIVKNDPKGTAPFILAGIEIAKLLENANRD